MLLFFVCVRHKWLVVCFWCVCVSMCLNVLVGVEEVVCDVC